MSEERTTAPHKSVLAPQAELGDEAPISLYVLTTEVVEEPTTLTDHEK